MASKVQPVTDPVILAAAQTFIDRSDRLEHPHGQFDNARRWYPDAGERCECCEHIRRPSRGYPFSWMKHCRSAVHLANLYDVDATLLRRAARQLRAAEALVETW